MKSNEMAHVANMSPASPARTNDAMRTALAAMTAVRPQLSAVQRADRAIPRMQSGVVFHAGPPIAPQAMCEPMRVAIAVALVLEGDAGTTSDALKLVDSGQVELVPNHDAGCVGPMAGVLTSSMPVWTVADEDSGRAAWCSLNEGSGAVLRYGADTPEVADRLRWMRDELAPALAGALESGGPVDLLPLLAGALESGDELHHRTHAATRLLAARLETSLPDAHFRFLADNHQTFLNVAMACAKLSLDATRGVEGCSLVTVIARNGVEVGIQLAGTGDRWFTGPAPTPYPVALFEPYEATDMCRDLGDSAIVEAYGLGAIAASASPEAALSVGLSEDDAIDRTERLRAIAAGDHHLLRIPGRGESRPAPLGLDARSIVEHDLLPPIHTGIAHRHAGIGQIGGGVSHPPMVAVRAAVDALDAMTTEI